MVVDGDDRHARQDGTDVQARGTYAGAKEEIPKKMATANAPSYYTNGPLYQPSIPVWMNHVECAVAKLAGGSRDVMVLKHRS